MNLTIRQFDELSDPAPWLAQIRACAWRAAPHLARLLETGTLEAEVGAATVYLLTDGDRLAAFLTLAQRDGVDEPAYTPWIGFVHTAPEYRGRRLAGVLIDHACRAAKARGDAWAYVCTDHVGLYEKYGFDYVETRPDAWGGESRIYRRKLT